MTGATCWCNAPSSARSIWSGSVTPCATLHSRSGAETMPLDPRLNAYRPDLADKRLADKVSAARYSQGQPHTVTAGLIDVRSQPRSDAGQTTQALMGET